MKYIITKEIKSETRVLWNIYWQDFMFIVLFVVLTIMLQGKVHAKLQILFIFFSIIVALILVLPSATNPKRKNYQAMALYFFKNNSVYKSARDERKEKKHETESGKKHKRAHSNRRLR